MIKVSEESAFVNYMGVKNAKFYNQKDETACKILQAVCTASKSIMLQQDQILWSR